MSTTATDETPIKAPSDYSDAELAELIETWRRMALSDVPPRLHPREDLLLEMASRLKALARQRTGTCYYDVDEDGTPHTDCGTTYVGLGDFCPKCGGRHERKPAAPALPERTDAPETVTICCGHGQFTTLRPCPDCNPGVRR